MPMPYDWEQQSRKTRTTALSRHRKVLNVTAINAYDNDRMTMSFFPTACTDVPVATRTWVYPQDLLQLLWHAKHLCEEVAWENLHRIVRLLCSPSLVWGFFFSFSSSHEMVYECVILVLYWVSLEVKWNVLHIVFVFWIRNKLPLSDPDVMLLGRSIFPMQAIGLGATFPNAWNMIIEPEWNSLGTDINMRSYGDMTR